MFLEAVFGPARVWSLSSFRCLLGGGSDVILRYVADTPLDHFTLSGRKVSNSSSSSSAVAADPAALNALNAKVDKLANFMKDAMLEIEALKSARSSATTMSEPDRGFVQNLATRCWHEVMIGSSRFQPSAWKTTCGWHFCHMPPARGGEIGEGPKCAKCFPHVCRSSSSSGSASS